MAISDWIPNFERPAPTIPVQVSTNDWLAFFYLKNFDWFILFFKIETENFVRCQRVCLGVERLASLCCLGLPVPFEAFKVCPEYNFRFKIIFANV